MFSLLEASIVLSTVKWRKNKNFLGGPGGRFFKKAPLVAEGMISKMKIAIIGSRGYPYVYSGYETFVKELAERLVKKDFSVTVYCHKNLFKTYPKQVNGIDLVYIQTIEKKTLSQFA